MSRWRFDGVPRETTERELVFQHQFPEPKIRHLSRLEKKYLNASQEEGCGLLTDWLSLSKINNYYSRIRGCGGRFLCPAKKISDNWIGHGMGG